MGSSSETGLRIRTDLSPVVRIDLVHYLHAGTFQPVDCVPVTAPRASSPYRTARPRCASRLPASGSAPAARFDATAGQRNASVSMSTATRHCNSTLSVARLGRKRSELKLVRPARPVLGVQVIERLGDLDRIDDQIAAVLVPRQCPSSG